MGGRGELLWTTRNVPFLHFSAQLDLWLSVSEHDAFPGPVLALHHPPNARLQVYINYSTTNYFEAD